MPIRKIVTPVADQNGFGHGGTDQPTASAVKELKRIKPEFSIKFAKQHLFYLKRADQMKTYIDGLAKAGIS